MRIALLLLGYAAILMTVGAGLLVRARWVDRAPRLAVLAWQALTTSILVSVTLAGFVLTVPTVPVAESLAGFLRACVMMIQAQYATPARAAVATAGLVLAAAVVGRVVFCLFRQWRRAASLWRRHLLALGLLGRPDDRLGATVVDHDAAEVYCVPGRGGRIVITNAALDALPPDRLARVLAHERAHLRGRHDLVVASAAALAAAFPGVSAFALAHEQISRLIELAADDVATGDCDGDRLTLAEGILAVAGGRTPAAALGAGGSTAAWRVRRLLAPRQRLGRLRAAVLASMVGALLGLPLVLAGAPAAAASQAAACPLPPLVNQSSVTSSR